MPDNAGITVDIFFKLPTRQGSTRVTRAIATISYYCVENLTLFRAPVVDSTMPGTAESQGKEQYVESHDVQYAETCR